MKHIDKINPKDQKVSMIFLDEKSLDLGRAVFVNCFLFFLMDYGPNFLTRILGISKEQKAEMIKNGLISLSCTYTEKNKARNPCLQGESKRRAFSALLFNIPQQFPSAKAQNCPN